VAESVAHDDRQFHDGHVLMRRLLNKPVPSLPVDEGLQQIADWHAWFRRAHEERLADLQLSPDQHARELADVQRIGEAVAERM
jgi:hypothetical protein